MALPQRIPRHRWGWTVRSGVPLGCILMLALMSTLPLRMPHDLPVVPDLSLMAVFYWTIYRPDLLPISALFVIGLIEDCVTGGSLGVTSLMLVGTHGMLLGQRRVFLGKPFALTWWGFALVATVASILRYLIACWQIGGFISATQALSQYIATLVLFPLIVALCVGLHRRLVPTTGAYL